MPHTPGPWKIFEDPRMKRCSGLVTAADGIMVVMASLNDQRTEKEIIANTHLIAAAPRLLESAKRFLDTSCNCENDYTCEMCDLRAAIAAAEGKEGGEQ